MLWKNMKDLVPEKTYPMQKYERCNFFDQGLCKMKQHSGGQWLDDSCDLCNVCEYWEGKA